MDEHNIKMAFQNVKRDMMELKSNLLTVAERLEKLEYSIEDSKASPLVQIKSSPKVAKKAAKKSSKKK